MNKYIGAVLLLAMASCGNPSQDTAKVGDSTAVTTSLVAKTVSLKDPTVQAIFAGYIVLKDALVNGNEKDARVAANELSGKLNAFKGCESTALIANKINTAKDLKEQRKEFTSLSADVIAMFKHADLKEGTIYVQHCPMANNGDGGDWLSAHKEIKNPYYGDEMMECGAVIEELTVVNQQVK
ncbi:hypothetical protein AAKU52_001580 [Pedobacter sp. CG_S7]|uniref:DUF3347 domain-containing protein n=1 Tax=Pedobacter sp. CG_S7 TaxID=3143930 RepID=UPI0033984A80